MPVPTAITALSETASANSPAGSENVGTQANDYIQAAFAFIRQLYDGNLLPLQNLNMNGHYVSNIAPGASATDAVNLQQLNGTWGAPSGTRVICNSAAAPAGWVIDQNTFYSDCSLRLVNTGAGDVGGSANWSSWNFGGQFSVDGHVLSNAEMPYHNHGDFGHNHGVNDPGHTHGVADPGHSHAVPGAVAFQGNSYSQEGTNSRLFNINGNPGTDVRGTGIGIYGAGTGISTAVAYANISYSGGNAPHNHTYSTPQMRYANVNIIQKQ